MLKRKSRSSVLIALILLLCVMMLGACIPYDQSFNDIDARIFSAHMKPCSNDETGKKAVLYDERIYYLSGELGQQGIYSMLLDGSDIRFEFPVEDIRAIQINDDGFFYSGYRNTATNSNGTYRLFRLYHRKDRTQAPYDVIVQFHDTADLTDANIWDFYFDSNDNLFVRSVEQFSISSDTTLFLLGFVNGAVVPKTDYQVLTNDDIVFQKDYPRESLFIYRTQDQYFILSNPIVSYSDEKIIGSRVSIALFDDALQRQVLPVDNLFLSRGDFSDFPIRWIVRRSQSHILIAGDNGLADYDLDAKAGEQFIRFPKRENLFAIYDSGNDLLLLTRRFRRFDLLSISIRGLFSVESIKGESLYRFNPETGQSRRLIKLGEKQAFLSVDDHFAAVAKGKQILIYDISTEKPELLRTIDLNHTIVDPSNEVDSAGGWLFLYRFNEETQRDELIEKVNIGA
ncbi:MAG: hypothetical protein LLF75_11900 [Eubacteriales bacterium]|nr:hypothetical protein [Eubacteriales bacterium]